MGEGEVPVDFFLPAGDVDADDGEGEGGHGIVEIRC